MLYSSNCDSESGRFDDCCQSFRKVEFLLVLCVSLFRVSMVQTMDGDSHQTNGGGSQKSDTETSPVMQVEEDAVHRPQNSGDHQMDVDVRESCDGDEEFRTTVQVPDCKIASKSKEILNNENGDRLTAEEFESCREGEKKDAVTPVDACETNSQKPCHGAPDSNESADIDLAKPLRCENPTHDDCKHTKPDELQLEEDSKEDSLQAAVQDPSLIECDSKNIEPISNTGSNEKSTIESDIDASQQGMREDHEETVDSQRKTVDADEDHDDDVEILDIEATKETLEEDEVINVSDVEDDDKDLMGFHFTEEGVLVDEHEKPFEFRKYKRPAENQKRYEKLGEKITAYVYFLLETRCHLKRVDIPLDAKPAEDQSFIFVSEGAFDTNDKLIIFIHGNGVVRAGQWARSLIINDNLKSGTQIPFIEEALRTGYEVMVLNTNLNTLSNKKWPDKDELIRGSEDPESHALYVWENLVESKAKAKHIAIVAHSYGGIVTKELLSKKTGHFFERVFAVAFTDSVHSINIASDPPEVIEYFQEHARNWVTSSLPLDEPIESEGFQEMKDVPRFSAGHIKHEWTSWSSFPAIFRFFSEKYDSVTEDLHKTKSSL